MTHQGARYKSIISSIFVITILICSSLLGIIYLGPKLHTAEAASIWSQTSNSDFRNGEFNNVTMVGSGPNTKLIINMTQRYTWTNKTLSSFPKSRWQHAMAPIYGSNKVLLFAGLHGITLNDTWIYNIDTDTWTQKFPHTSPRHRHLHAMASVYGDDKVVLFGGSYSGDLTGGSNRNDTWVYDLSDNNWTKKNPINYPIKRQRHAMVSIFGDDKVLLFGGGNGYRNHNYNDTWVYDLSADTWTQKNPINSPFVRDSHAMASIDGDDKVLLFGGRLYSSTGTYYFGDTWIYDLSDNTWTFENHTSKPHFRCNSAMVTIYDTDRVVLYGGSFFKYYLFDTWIYDLSQNLWINKTLTIEPLPRWMHAMAPIHGTDKVVLFGGNPDDEYYHYLYNDTWIFQHYSDKKNGTYISIPYDTGSNSSFSKINWSSITPVDSKIEIQLRSTANKSSLSTQSFIGPDGTSLTFYNESNTEIWSGHTGDRWIQYKIYFGLDRFTETPILKNVTITYNCLPRIIILSPSNGSISTIGTPTFTWTFEDFDSLTQQAFQVLLADDFNFTNVSYDSGIQKSPNEYWTFPMDTNYSNTVLADGTWFWKARTQDEDGTWSESSTPSTLKIDTKPPSSEPTIPVNDGFYNWLPTLSGIATEPPGGSGVFSVELTICRLSDNYYWDGVNWVPIYKWLNAVGTTEWTYDSNNVRWETGIKYGVQSRASDFGGNIELPDSENVFTLDELPPVSKIDAPVDGTWLKALEAISGSSFDIHGSGVANVEISIKCVENDNTRNEDVNDFWSGEAWKSTETWLLVNGTEQWSYNSSAIPWSTGNRYLIRSRATDSVGNLEYPGTGIVFNYDDSPPEQLTIQINNGEEFTQKTEVNLSLHAVDFGSGCAQMSFSIDDLEWSRWEPFTANRSFSLQPNDGVRTVYFKVMDRAGNIAESVFDNITLDSTPPDGLSVFINNNSKYTNSNQVTLKLTARDLGSGVGNMSFSYNGINWLSWEPFDLTRSISLPPNEPDGELRIFFKVSDKIGNVADPIYDSIFLDQTPPHSLSIFINKGALEINVTSVTIDLFALDNLSGVHQMSLSTDGENWDAWENYLEKIPYDLPPGEGIKTIYFKVKDYAGNIAEPVKAKIVLKTPSELPESIPSEPSSTNFKYWVIASIIFIILIIIISLGLILFKKQKRRDKQNLLLAKVVTVKPETLPGTAASPEQVPPAPKPTLLPSSTPASPTQLPTIAATPTPILAKITQEHQPPEPMAQELPALPPVQDQDTISEPGKTASEDIDTHKP